MFGCFFSAAAVVDSNFKVSPSKTANEVAEANKSVSFFFFFFWDTTICGVHHQEEEVFFHWLTVLMLVYCLSLCFNSGWMLAQSSWWLGSHKNFFAICIYSVCSFIQGDTHTLTHSGPDCSGAITTVCWLFMSLITISFSLSLFLFPLLQLIVFLVSICLPACLCIPFSYLNLIIIHELMVIYCRASEQVSLAGWHTNERW